jgi:hypothetical protein
MAKDFKCMDEAPLILVLNLEPKLFVNVRAAGTYLHFHFQRPEGLPISIFKLALVHPQ